MKAANIYFHEQKIKPAQQIGAFWFVQFQNIIATVYLTDALTLINKNSEFNIVFW